MKFRSFSPVERKTTGILLIAALFNGAVQSLSQTQDIIARKALLAQDWQLMLMTMIWPVSNFFSIWWGRFYEKSCHKSRFFLFAGIFGRLTLVYAIWLTTMNEYLVLLGLLFSANSILIPAQNSIYQKNIHHTRRAKVYGYTISLGMIVSVAVTFAAGKILDLHEEHFRWILVVTGLAGFISSALLSMVKLQAPIIEPPCKKEKIPFRKIVLDPIHRTLELMKSNKAFAAFERDFSIYGMGYIMMQPIIPIYMVDKLQLSYTNNFLAKGILSQVGMLFLSPLIGKLHDRLHPFRFIAASFALLMVFPLLFVLSSLWAGESVLAVIIVFIAYTIFGIAMAGVNLSWNMSSIFFAGKEDASMYQSVHVTMTGIRGLIAPILGFALLKIMGINSVFYVAAGFLALASVMSLRDYMRFKHHVAEIVPDTPS
ncbi:MAG: MFS transporter [Candidatus Cloacimonetes bacterium]|nr:MFS transporter [Candidatus Cloacimonadota bacterium]MDD2683256.1 MFS transporter [Candidatus Cloacimonadota bacterium]MDD3097075.1 MFS transporter [Candidatus Cloacimonadota bacterium]MDD3578175.1 MFS transporter [Candidatus Cloacimonadota bacterium]MDD4667294.1 MFS transporter [Candidatus Cloacimonadota bacterium]